MENAQSRRKRVEIGSPLPFSHNGSLLASGCLESFHIDRLRHVGDSHYWTIALPLRSFLPLPLTTIGSNLMGIAYPHLLSSKKWNPNIELWRVTRGPSFFEKPTSTLPGSGPG
uniref:Uncharacterized protein n=1 Tax=Moniliophthora roreri TaxID=221103 RepID=A0A0W0FF02_MONRR